MDSSQHLFTESFSYSWLMNVNGDGGRGSPAFIDMDDPELFSKRWNAAGSLDFDFDLPAALQPDGALVHADQLIADGLLLPLHLVHPPPETSLAESALAVAADSVLLRSLSAGSSKSLLSRSDRSRSCCAAAPRPAVPSPSSSSSTLCTLPPSWRLGSARSSSSSSSSSCKEKKAFRFLCLVLLPNLYKRVKELVRKRRAARSTAVDSNGSSTRHGDALYFSNKCVKADAGAERAIYDAVLHCKNSFGKLQGRPGTCS